MITRKDQCCKGFCVGYLAWKAGTLAIELHPHISLVSLVGKVRITNLSRRFRIQCVKLTPVGTVQNGPGWGI